jgi:hypothetical protein
MTVGCVPVLPAGERSCVGIGAIADEPAPPALEVVVEEAALALVVEVVADVVGELLHPASPRTEADSTISDQLRRRDMHMILSDDGPIPSREVGQVGQTVVGSGPRRKAPAPAAAP